MAGGIAGVAVIPSAPLLVAGTASSATAEATDARSRVADALASLPAADLLILVAAGAAGAVHEGPLRADLAGIGLPGVEVEAKGHEAVGLMAEALGYALEPSGRLPLDLAVLTLLAMAAEGDAETRGGDVEPGDASAGDPEPGGSDGAVAPGDAPRGGGSQARPDRTPMAAITVPAAASFHQLSADGAAIAEWLGTEGLQAAVVVAGDLSAALRPSAPVFLAEDSRSWDERALAAIGGDLGDLGALGPAEALRVGARGWPALAALHGILAAAGRRLGTPWYSPYSGVGYVVARDA